MARARIATYLETGGKRVFAGAVEWPGWCRGGRDPEAAVQALFDYRTRYARVLRGTRLGFEAPSDPSDLAVVERLEGNATTDFGAPSIAPEADTRPIDEAELRRLRTILRACWRSFDATVDGAGGKRLAKGPRGGGRDLRTIVEHVVDADGSYLRMVARKVDTGPKAQQIDRTRAAIVNALEAGARDGPAPPGPRGGKRWLPRYFLRRVAWHVLDHAWEIEDRAA
jgi:hypothetical protein